MRQLMLTAIALLIGASSSLAQGHMGTPQEQQACTRDAQRFCRKQLGDDSAVQQCLQQNRQIAEQELPEGIPEPRNVNWRVAASGGNRRTPAGRISPKVIFWALTHWVPR